LEILRGGWGSINISYYLVFLIVIVIANNLYRCVYVYTEHRNQQLNLMLLLKLKTVQKNKYNISINLIMNSCQAPIWTSMRLQPPKHQLCFAVVLHLGAPTPMNSVLFSSEAPTSWAPTQPWYKQVCCCTLFS